jgi:hypothetical protein
MVKKIMPFPEKLIAAQLVATQDPYTSGSKWVFEFVDKKVSGCRYLFINFERRHIEFVSTNLLYHYSIRKVFPEFLVLD